MEGESGWCRMWVTGSYSDALYIVIEIWPTLCKICHTEFAFFHRRTSSMYLFSMPDCLFMIHHSVLSSAIPSLHFLGPPSLHTHSPSALSTLSSPLSDTLPSPRSVKPFAQHPYGMAGRPPSSAADMSLLGQSQPPAPAWEGRSIATQKLRLVEYSAFMEAAPQSREHETVADMVSVGGGRNGWCSGVRVEGMGGMVMEGGRNGWYSGV